MCGRLVLIAALGLAAAPVAGAAQCRLCSTPTSAPSEEASGKPMSLEVESTLDFDQLVLLGPGEGTATLRPDGTRLVSGMIGEMGGRSMVGTAVVRGEPGRALRIDLPRHIELYSLSGGRVAIEDVISDLPSLPRLDSTGRLQFRFGGKLRISGDAEGDYRGDLPITVEYL